MGLTDPNPLLKEVQELAEKKGKKALEIARNALMQELRMLKSNNIKKAVKYFMYEYWLDTSRPALILMVSEALNGQNEIMDEISASLILISGGIDIHDDVIDESKTKFGKPTVYGKFGKDVALLVGDALLFTGFILLHKNGKAAKEKYSAILDVIKSMFFELGDAEALELKFRKHLLNPRDYIEIIRRKAADVEAHTRIAAILSCADQDKIEMLGKFGRLLGMLLIIRDDIMDMLDKNELKNRIVKEHLPLPIFYAARQKDIAHKFEKILKKRSITRRDVEFIREAVKKANGFSASQKIMQKLAHQAISSIKGLENNQLLCKLVQCISYEI
jgi:heptaprenyl diphosphate synthase